MSDGFAHQSQRGEVQYGIETFGQQAIHRLRFEQICDHQTRLRRNRLAMAGLEVVEHNDLVVRRHELAGDDRSDVARSACDEQLHFRGRRYMVVARTGWRYHKLLRDRRVIPDRVCIL
jgi:hypothetical protein